MTDKWWHDIDISGLGLELGKHPCIQCASSDAMHVYETKAFCFSCGTHFDAPDILMAQTGCTFVEALTQLKGSRARMRDPEKDLAGMFGNEPDSQQGLNDSFNPPFECPNPWHDIGEALQNAPLCQTARDWLEYRGLSHELCHELGVRSMHPSHWKGVKGLIGGEQAARKAGIIADSKKSNHPYFLPWYRYPWLLLPYTDEHWQWTTVRHRATHQTDDPKILSPKGDQPAPFPFLAMQCEDYFERFDEPLFVVEGETDALSLWEIGYPAVASPGASVWPQAWREWLKGQAERRHVYVVGDGDDAGRGFARMVARGMPDSVRKAVWSAKKDANDLLMSNELTQEIEMIIDA